MYNEVHLAINHVTVELRVWYRERHGGQKRFRLITTPDLDMAALHRTKQANK